MTKFYDNDGELESWEIKHCKKCGYAIDLCDLTKNWKDCPLCAKRGIKSELVDALTIYRPIPGFKLAKVER